jgi:hypothetical protein
VLWRYLLVFLSASFLATWAGPLLGRLMGLEPVGVWIASALGPLGGVLAVVALGSWLEARALRSPWAARVLDRVERTRAAAERLRSRGGIAAIALVTPITVGFTVGTAAALAIGVRPRAVMIWMAASGALWAAVFTAIFYAF